MTRAPQTHDPVHRVSMAFDRTEDGLWVTTWLEPGGNLPEHFHPTLTETWEVLEGSAGVKLAASWRGLTAADGPVLVEPGVRHALRNTSGHTAHLRTWVTPPAGSRTSCARAPGPPRTASTTAPTCRPACAAPPG